jgi:hypothetical protein
MHWIVDYVGNQRHFSFDNFFHMFQGGKLTVSKLGGPFGIKQFCAIINPPQLAILAISSGKTSCYTFPIYRK